MAKPTAKKAAWYAEYDRLFVKPPRPENPTPIGRRTVVIIILFALMPVALFCWPLVRTTAYFIRQAIIVKTSTDDDDTDESTDKVTYRDNFALKRAGVKRTAPIDSSRNLVLRVDDHTVSFSNGYQLVIAPSFHVEETASEHAVTPTTMPGNFERSVADFEADKADVQANLQLYANLIGDFNAYTDVKTPNLVKVFPGAPIRTVQTGYVFVIPGKHDRTDYAELTRYFAFPDGTGVVLEAVPDITKRMRTLSSSSDFAAFQAAFGRSFQSLDKDYTFTAPASH
ncbi:MAG: hypothetical protein LKJ69_07260 [Lactobacillus sp.]|jgi:hypothetical protein|nr:hypothetical protein [Lactobacillus sp.]MCI2033189.1 hypothetical protein [Lactobacillus sp.]